MERDDGLISDPARLAALRATGLLDSEPEPEFDRLTRVAARLLQAPVAGVSLVDHDRQFFKSCVGVAEPWGSQRETARSRSFCQYVVTGGEPLVIRDAREHPVVRENLAIRDLDVIAYLGIPIFAPGGEVLGSFCVIDSEPRDWSEDDVAAMSDLAHSVMTEIELRHELREREQALSALADAQRIAHVGSWSWDRDRDEATWSEEMYGIFDRPESEGPAKDGELLNRVHPADRSRVIEAFAAFRDEDAFALDFRLLVDDGRERAVNAHGRRERPGRYVGTVQDVTVLRAIERDALAADRSFAGILENAPIGMALVALDGRWVRVNRALCQITGFTEVELLARTFQEITHPDDLEADLEYVRRLLAGEINGYRMEKRYFHKNGDVAWIELSVSLLRDERGEPHQLIAQIQDITATHEARRRLELIVENLAGSAITLYDRDLRLRFCRGPLVEEFDIAEFVGKRLHEYASESALELLPPMFERALAGESSSAVLDQDRRGRTLAVHVAPYREADGSIDAILAHWHDISDIREAEDARRRAEERFRRAFDDAPIGMVLVGTDGRFQQVNSALCEMTGRTPEELIDANAFDFVYPDDRERVRAEFTALDTAGDSVTAQYRIAHWSGAPLWVLAQATLIRNANGEPQHALVQVQDITERREYEHELHESREHALAASRLKSEFVANMSHEIRTPLNGIVSVAQLLLDSGLPAEQHQYAQVSATSAQALMRIIDDILDFSKIEAGKLEILTEDYELHPLIAEVCAIVGAKARGKDLKLSFEVDPALPENLIGDAGRVRQILLNLAGNAVKFTPAGAVEIRARRSEAEQGARLRIEVSDTGVGLSREELGRLFQPFTQVDASTTRRYGGTGLGLSIAKQLAELMGGEIGAHSTPDVGSTFWLELPCRAGCAPQSQTALALEPSPQVSLRPPHAARVLVAEDNEINQFTATRVFEKLGFSVEIAANGREAIELSARRRYAAIFMDCQMPELDGYEATREIRRREADGPRTPIIAMTASTMAGDRERCLGAGMDDYLAKPIPFDQLADICRGLAAQAEGPVSPAHPPEPASEPAFDPTQLEQLASGEQIASLLTVFLDQLEAGVAELDAAIAGADGDVVHRVAHRLAGSAATIGAPAVAAAARALCSQAISPAEERDRAYGAFLDSVTRTTEAVRSYAAAGRSAAA